MKQNNSSQSQRTAAQVQCYKLTQEEHWTLTLISPFGQMEDAIFHPLESLGMRKKKKSERPQPLLFTGGGVACPNLGHRATALRNCVIKFTCEFCAFQEYVSHYFPTHKTAGRRHFQLCFFLPFSEIVQVDTFHTLTDFCHRNPQNGRLYTREGL